MPTLNLSNEQVIELVKQLPIKQKSELFRFLLLQNWEEWGSLSDYGFHQAKLIAQQRGYDWDKMTEEQRETLIDDILHE